MPPDYHVPVMLHEVIEGLNIQPEGIYVDCTFGGGGHSRLIIENLNAKGRLIVFDQDQDASRNVPPDERIIFIHQNFRHIQRFLRLHKIMAVNGILADLGVSSHQFDEAERGFSTRMDAPMDMRMDRRQSVTAQTVIREYPEEKLHKIFEQYGEVTNSKTLAKTIVANRRNTPMQTIEEFKTALHGVVKGNPNKYFAQVFQALRIEVNDELGALAELLQQVPDLLLSKGRIVVLTFHSLEDRLVKNFFRNGGLGDEGDEVFGTKRLNPLKIITKKPVIASNTETKQNPRARSAKLRIAEKI